jgi:hypothetical protein
VGYDPLDFEGSARVIDEILLRREVYCKFLRQLRVSSPISFLFDFANGTYAIHSLVESAVFNRQGASDTSRAD